MVPRTSRYRKLPDDVTVDVKGRRLRSKSLRPTPRLAGKLIHTLEQGERLDHLAFKYYRRSRDWWRICDAAPEILSPWDLVGAGPRVAVRFEVVRLGREPRWSQLLTRLRRAPGVEGADLGSREQPVPDLDIDWLDEEQRPFRVRDFGGDLKFREALRQSVLEQELEDKLRNALVSLFPRRFADRTREEEDPPRIRLDEVEDDAVWRIQDLETGEIYRLEHHDGDGEPRLVVYDTEQTWRWTLTVVFNRLAVSFEDLEALIANPQEPPAATPEEVGRVGAPLAIPTPAS